MIATSGFLTYSFRVHQIRFRPGFRPGPRWGSLERSPTSKGKGRGGGKEGKEREGKGKVRGEGLPPYTQITGSAPVLWATCSHPMASVT